MIISEPSASDPSQKPSETHQLIENFCLGQRRLELFARAPGVRRGWVAALAAGEDARLAAAGVSVIPPDDQEGEEGGEVEVVVDADGQERVEVRRRRDGWEEGEGVRARRWERERWEREVAEMSGGRGVVPSSPGMWFGVCFHA